jgi:hypothetical protein
MDNKQWGEGEMAPLETRKAMRDQRAKDEREAGGQFNHADFLKDVNDAERNGERGVGAQLAAGVAPATAPEGGGTGAGDPASAPAGAPASGWQGAAPVPEAAGVTASAPKRGRQQ